MKKDTFLYVNAFLMDSCFSIVGICVPLYALQFGATYDDLGHINAWGALAYSVTSLVSGRLSDRMGYRQIMRIGSFCLFLAFVGYIGVNRIWHFILLSVLTAVAIAHYWPPMQAYLGRGKSRDMLLPALGRFNVAWTLGVFVGPAAGGVLFSFHPFSGFILSGLFVLLLFVGLIVVPILEPEPGVATARSVVATSGHFFPLALLANFATFFVIGFIRTLFPKLATDLGISPDLLGFLLALIALTQLAVFYFMSRTDRWQFRLSPIIFAQLLAALGLGLIGIGTQPIVFACGFLLLGMLIGVTFTASIFYSLYTEGPGGRRTGIHEAIVGSGFLFGPLLGGLVAEHFNARLPYLMGSMVILATIGIQLLIHKMKAPRGFVPQTGD